MKRGVNAEGWVLWPERAFGGLPAPFEYSMRVQPAIHSQRSLALWPSVDGPVSGFLLCLSPRPAGPRPSLGLLNGEQIGGPVRSEAGTCAAVRQPGVDSARAHSERSDGSVHNAPSV